LPDRLKATGQPVIADALSDDEVKVRPRREAGVAHDRDRIAAPDPVAFIHADAVLRHVRVNAYRAILVLDDQAVGAECAGIETGIAGPQRTAVEGIILLDVNH